MTDEYLEEQLRFMRKLCPGFSCGRYNETEYDEKVDLIYQKYLKEVGRASLKHLNVEQLKELNRRCKEAAQ